MLFFHNSRMSKITIFDGISNKYRKYAASERLSFIPRKIKGPASTPTPSTSSSLLSKAPSPPSNLTCASSLTPSTKTTYLTSPQPYNASLPLTLPGASSQNLHPTSSPIITPLAFLTGRLSSSRQCSLQLRNSSMQPNKQTNHPPTQQSSLTSPTNLTLFSVSNSSTS